MDKEPCPYQPIPQRRIAQALTIIHQQQITNQWCLEDIETALTGTPHTQTATTSGRQQ